MLGILFTILKIILWVILGILGLILLLLLLVLFCPIRYKLDVDYHEMAYVEATIRYLIVKVKVLYDQRTKDMQQVIRVFGFRIGKGKKKDKKSSDERIDNEESLDGLFEEFESMEGIEDASKSTQTDATDIKLKPEASKILDEDVDIEKTDIENIDEDPSIKEDTEATDDMVDPMYDLWDEELKEPLPEGEKKLFGRIISLLKKLVHAISKLSPSNIMDKISNKKAKLDKKINRVKKFWNLSCTVKTRAYLKKYIKSLFKHILPRKVKGYVHYGFDEPYKTGQITGYLSWMPFVYQKHLSIQPDFYNKVMEANLSLKGKIRLGYLARIALNINIWRTLKALRRITK